MADTFGAISLSNMTRLLERRVPQKPIRYHTIPRLVVESVKLQPRSFSYNLPIGPHRPSSDMSRPPALGLGDIRGLKEKRKPDLTSQEPHTILPPIMKEQDRENKESLSFQEKDAGKSSVDDELVPLPSHEKNSDLVVKKDAGKASVHDEQFVPLPSHEKNSDLVRYRAVRYEPGPEIWQKVACAWDQFQTRPNQFHQYESDSLFPAIPTATVRLDENQELGTVKPAQEPVRIPKMAETGEGRNTRFTRPTPGYGGYVSRYPVEPRPPQGTWDEVFVNFSKLTYRLYPSYEYTKKEFAHKGPLSRLVTTTHPSNPFNKVDKWNSRPKKLCKRAKAKQSKFV